MKTRYWLLLVVLCLWPITTHADCTTIIQDGEVLVCCCTGNVCVCT